MSMETIRSAARSGLDGERLLPTACSTAALVPKPHWHLILNLTIVKCSFNQAAIWFGNRSAELSVIITPSFTADA